MRHLKAQMESEKFNLKISHHIAFFGEIEVFRQVILQKMHDKLLECSFIFYLKTIQTALLQLVLNVAIKKSIN